MGTFRASLQDTIRYVNYHLNIGIDHLFVFFDDPSDPAIEALAGYPDVSCFRCDASHWESNGFTLPLDTDDKQIINANLAFVLAKEMGLDWITHIDSDELIHAEEDIGTILRRMPKEIDVVDFQVMEAVPEELHYDNMFAAVKLFRAIPGWGFGGRRFLAKLLGCKNVFFNGEYFRGHDRKTAVRVDSKIKSLSIHAPAKNKEQDYQHEKSNDLKLLHYDGCGLEYWSAKWSRRLTGETVFPHLRLNRTQQRDRIYRALREGREELVNAYKEIQFIEARNKPVLLSLGLLRRIVLDKELFEMPRITHDVGP